MQAFAFMLLFLAWLPQAESDPNPIELGQVQWERDLDIALSKAQQVDRPVFILFQEIPGCATCRNYGQDILTDPLIVEAIESLFIPVAIYNNRPGKDAKILKSFGEPSWNNPVVRIVNPLKADLSPRLSGDYSKAGVIQAMITALETDGQTPPPYLSLLLETHRAHTLKTETAVFSMYCFWSGEKGFGDMPGLVASEPGFMRHKEVVKVEYNPQVISYEEVLEYATEEDISSHVFVANDQQAMIAEKRAAVQQTVQGPFRPDHTPKYYLAQTDYRFVPMTKLQASKAN
ncbi:MAG: VPGUxxT family thioredoxin-like (seleno)protein, type 2, partial [Bacteroidota bacterium]